MKAAAVLRYHFNFEYWTPVLDGAELNYQHIRDDKGLAIPINGGDIALVTAVQMASGGMVRGMTDRTGTPMFITDDIAYDMYVQSATPQLDPFSRVIGWRHLLRRTLPRDLEQTLADLAASV